MTDGTEEAAAPSLAAGAAGGTGLDALRAAKIVAVQEYRLAIRNRLGPGLAALFAAFGLAIVAFGGSRLGPVRADAVVVSLASLATYLVPLAALAAGYDAVVGADESGWLDVVFALPVARGTVVAGIALGRAAVLAAAIVLGFGSAGAVLAVLAGGLDPALYLRFLLGAAGMGVAVLAVTVAISTLAREKTHALGGALAAWVWFTFVHDLLALGAVAALPLPDPVLTAFVLLNPADVFRVLVLSGVGTTGGGIAAVLVTVGIGPGLLAAALIGWCVLPAAAAARLARRRTV